MSQEDLKRRRDLAFTRALDLVAEGLGRPAVIATMPGVLREDGVVDGDVYVDLLQFIIAQGVCPWDGDSLTSGGVCRHATHGNGIRWGKNGDACMLN